VARLRWLALIGGLAIVAGVSGGGLGQAASAGLPLAITSASLSQRGRELVWQIVLASPFSPAALARDGRTVCLLFERPADGTVIGEACLSGPASHSGTPRLTYARVTTQGAQDPTELPATVTRASARELSASFLPPDPRLSYKPLRWQVISTLAAHACASPQPGGARCFALFPRTSQLLDLHTPVLTGCATRGPLWVFHGPSSAHEIALTFDDGPSPYTAPLLRVLEREHVVATFFQIGDQVSQYAKAGLDRRMLADGDMIGDHTWNYGGDVVAGGPGAALQIRLAAAAIRRASGRFEPCLFRAPGGKVTPPLLRTARLLGFTTIQWDVDPRDWARPGAVAIYENVVSHAHNGAIVIQHDGGGDRSETLAALPREIATLRRRGYRFVTVTQLLGYEPIYS
jgi:peptidoglycan/xylan/chitin deacetylase (PgdA/CDA1 family)